MVLSAGRCFGPYEIVSPLGAGGMGEVYRARDTKLKREVALKILPAHVSQDVERLARFEREARVLASLNHPHIAAIYGVEETDGVRALVLELVEGPTLAERLGRGALSVREALSTARQIAEALDAAHEKGIVHRDLKPANIKVTPDGIVKVLDFGIAKIRAPEEAAAEASTVTTVGTRPGTLLGTAAYMSPEQARAQAVDKRADIWAFGCVLYEMLTGRAVFAGETASDTLARVLEREPEWERLPASTPPHIRRLMRRCLAKDANKRLRDIGDVRLELEEPPESSPSAERTANVRTLRVALSACVGVAIVAAGVAIWSLARIPSVTPAEPVRFTIDLQVDEQLAFEAGLPRPLAISPDGRTVLYGTRRPDGNRIYARRLDSIESMPIAGTEGGIGPFVSPDGESVAFASGGFLRRVPIEGGPSQTIVAVQNFMSGSWGPDDTIVYTQWGSGLFKVSARGGTPEPLTSVDETRGELQHTVPHVLPAGNAVLFAVQSRSEAPRLDLVEIATGRRRPLFEGSDPHYVSSGHVVFIRSGALHAIPFDVDRLEPTGPVTRILDTASIAGDPNRGVLAVASDGTLVYQPAGEGPSRLVWVDRKGSSTRAIDQPQRFVHPRLSPDGTRVVVWLPQQAGGNELWIYDLVRKTRLRLSARGQVSRPIWSHDGKRITFQKDGSLYSMPADDSAGPELVLAPTAPATGLFPLAWSRDGTLVYSRPARATNRDVFTLGIDGAAAAFLHTPRDERSAMLSPDGRWMLYAALEPGREEEVYVQRYPGPGERVVVSPGGGREPVWSPLGNEIFYRSIDGRRLMAVDVTTDPALRIGSPRLLFEGDFQTGSFWSNYDVTPDAKQFLMIERSAAPQSRLQVVVHATESLGKQEQ